ncbi:hypothetical protein EV363DRAFT_1238634, partial [Boletus edulis]
CTLSFQLEVRPSSVLIQPNTVRLSLDLFKKFASIPLHSAKDAFPRSLRSPTLNLASNLTGVLILLAGRWWAELFDGDDEPYLQEKDAEPPAESASS